MNNPFEDALLQLTRAVALRPVREDVLLRLRSPEREVSVAIPVVMDSGSTQIFEGYRVQHNHARGPYKGGIRFHPDTNKDEVRALALWMTIKTAVANIPMGGGKGGITVDPKKLSPRELEALSRGWVQALYPVLGPRLDVPAPDVNTNPAIMAIMTDEYTKLTGDTTGATFTGKPLDRGGSEGRTLATSLGGWFVFDVLRDAFGVPAEPTVAIQGMGNVGGNAARIFAQHGARIVAMSDSHGGIVNMDGLDVDAVESYKQEHGTLDGFPNAQRLGNEDLLELPVDVLIPAALEDQITGENVGRIHARMILELANGPTTPEADDALFARGIPVVPDILANAGGVVVSTFEWEQNLKGEHWSEADVNARLQEIMSRETRAVLARAGELGTDLRRGAFVIALERLESAMMQEMPRR